MIEVRSTVKPSATSPADVRPVLTAMVGSPRARRNAISRVLDALGEHLVVLPVHQDLSPEDLRALHKQLGEHLAGGRSVLVDATNTDKSDRRALLDVASRYLASTLAVVCGPAAAGLVATLPAEGWQAVVVVAR